MAARRPTVARIQWSSRRYVSNNFFGREFFAFSRIMEVREIERQKDEALAAEAAETKCVRCGYYFV
jgi:hypothetical protein